MASDLRVLRVGLSVLTCLVCAVGCGDAPEETQEAPALPLEQIASPRAPSAPNGLDQLSADQALGRVLQEVEANDSYHVTGTTVGGQTLDISFVDNAATGTVIAGSRVQLLAVDGRIYVTGDDEFMAASVGKDAAKRMSGKWLLLAPDATSQFALFADGRTFAARVLGAQGPVELTGVRYVQGRPAVGLIFAETGGTLWVSAHGDPLPLQFEEKGATAGVGVLTFSDFGADITVKAPPKDSVVDAVSLPTP
ncbi:MAG: hypothetical protein ICV70_00110 [Jiangellaceae bacterium]|nr:hypothetical protein [Jiangellaceae bacterium]